MIAGQRGIALVLVLWATTLLTVIAASFMYSIRSDTLLVQNLVASARAEVLAEAGVQRAIYELLKPSGDKQRWKGDGVPRQWEFGDAKLSILIQDVSGKIDLNNASEVLLKGLLKSAGLDELQSNSLFDAIQDWRDSDDLRRANGAEAAEYLAAGLKYTPSNVSFETIDELKRVLGMTPQLYAKLADALTVESRQPGVNAAIASRKVLLALPGADAAQVDAYLAARQQARDNNTPLPPFPPATAVVAGDNGSVYTVRAEALLADGVVFVREAVVKINQGAVRKFVFLSWKEGEATPKSSGEEKPVIYDK